MFYGANAAYDYIYIIKYLLHEYKLRERERSYFKKNSLDCIYRDIFDQISC